MYEIYLGIKRKWSISRISREIEVSATTVLREIRRNSNANGYNPLEINLKNVVSKNVTVKNCKLANFSNNAMSVFGMAEGGVLNIENCTFDLAKTSEAVRISNKTNTKFTINEKIAHTPILPTQRDNGLVSSCSRTTLQQQKRKPTPQCSLRTLQSTLTM